MPRLVEKSQFSYTTQKNFDIGQNTMPPGYQMVCSLHHVRPNKHDIASIQISNLNYEINNMIIQRNNLNVQIINLIIQISDLNYEINDLVIQMNILIRLNKINILFIIPHPYLFELPSSRFLFWYIPN